MLRILCGRIHQEFDDLSDLKSVNRTIRRKFLRRKSRSFSQAPTPPATARKGRFATSKAFVSFSTDFSTSLRKTYPQQAFQTGRKMRKTSSVFYLTFEKTGVDCECSRDCLRASRPAQGEASGAATHRFESGGRRNPKLLTPWIEAERLARDEGCRKAACQVGRIKTADACRQGTTGKERKSPVERRASLPGT